MFEDNFDTLDAWGKWPDLPDTYTPVFETDMVPANAYIVGGGGLQIKADYVEGVTNESDLIQSTATYLYGYFECRAKVPSGQGLWPGFWMYDVSHAVPKPEIDIMEIITFGTIDFTNYKGGSKDSTRNICGDLSDDYHIFACKWEADKVTYYIDNVPLAINYNYIPDSALHLMISLYVAGTAGTPDPGITFPVYLDVDYVKVWQK